MVVLPLVVPPGIDGARLHNRIADGPDRLLPGPVALRSPTCAALPIGDLAHRLQGRRSRCPRLF